MASVGTVAAVLRGLREARNLSLAEAARRADVSRATLHNWENGVHAPSGPGLERLLDAVRADPRERAALLAAAAPRHAEIVLAGEPLGPPVGRGALLRAMRGRRGLTQGAVAQAMGATQSAVAKWESGDSVPSDETLARLLALLAASPEEAAAVRRSGEPDGPITLEGARARLVGLFLPDQAGAEPALLAQEAELWAQAVRDPRWEPALVLTMAYRSYWLRVFGGRPRESFVLARKTIELAGRSGSWSQAALAYPGIVEHTPDGPYSAAMLARELRRSEALASKMPNPRLEAVVRVHPWRLIAFGEASPRGLDDHYRRIEEGFRPYGEREDLESVDWAEGRLHQILAYLWLGRFDDAARLEAEAPWHLAGAFKLTYLREIHVSRLLAYIKFGVHPSAEELLRAEALPRNRDGSHFLDQWRRMDRNRPYWRAYLNA